MSTVPLLEAQNPWWRDPDARLAAVYPVRRDIHETIYNSLGGTRAIVLGGARQIGKSVLLQQFADRLLGEGWPPGNLTRFDFSDERLVLPGGQPFSARDVVEAAPQNVVPDRPRVFLFDEIGQSLNWAPWLKQAVDASRASAVKHIYVVTDSAATLLLSDAGESGVGRWDEYRLETLSFREYLRFMAWPDESEDEVLRRIPNALERYLRRSGFPEHVYEESEATVRRRLRADIADRSIRRDLLRFDLDVEKALRLFVYLVQNSGAAFDATKCASLLQADRRAVQKWAHHLEGMHLLERLDRHAVPPSARLRQTARVYAADHGLISAFAAAVDPLGDEAVRAAVFEALVFRHLRDVPDVGPLGYYRSESGQEADFVLHDAAGRVVIIEVTGSARLRSEKLERMQEISRKLKAARRVLVYGGFVPQRKEHGEILPLQAFLLDPRRAAFGEEAR